MAASHTSTFTAQDQGTVDWGFWLRWSGTFAVLLLIISVSAGFINWLVDPEHSPLRRVEIEGEFHYLDKSELQAALEPMLNAGFFKVDVAAIQESVKAMPWVDKAAVRRLWPDLLHIDVVEQKPAARWGERDLLNPRGEQFTPSSLQTGLRLPLLSGPDGHSGRVLQSYHYMNDMLSGLGLTIDKLTQDARRAWRLILSNGVVVELGRNNPEQRLARFIRAYPAILASTPARIAVVDLRYSNGFAVRWQPGNTEKQAG